MKATFSRAGLNGNEILKVIQQLFPDRSLFAQHRREGLMVWELSEDEAVQVNQRLDEISSNRNLPVQVRKVDVQRLLDLSDQDLDTFLNSLTTQDLPKILKLNLKLLRVLYKYLVLG